MNQEQVLALLECHAAFDADEREHVARTIAFVRKTPLFWPRTTAEGHITASAWIVSHDGGHALLIHHRKLDRWFQPGGHIENDTDLIAAATREATEETGLQHLQLVAPAIFDVDVHPIPGNAKEPGHYHYDIRFAFRTDRDAPLKLSAESKDLRWFALAQAPHWAHEASLLRMARKSAALIQSSGPRAIP